MLRHLKIVMPLALAACLAAPSAWARITTTKSFSPATVAAGQNSTLTITIVNAPPPGNPGNLSFTDTYPAGLVNAATPAVTNTCGGTVTAAPNANTLSLSGATTLSGNASCTITVSVTSSTPNTYTNSVTVSSTNSGTSAAIGILLVTPSAAVGSFNAFETSTAAGATSGQIYTKLAGVAFSLDVVAVSGGAQSSGFTAAVTVDLLGNSVTGIALDAQNCPTSYTVLQTVSPNPTITGGRSTVSFAAVATAWQDVRVRVRYPTSSPTVTSCSTDNFSIRPAAFSVTSTNANNVSKTGTPAIAAGAGFNLTATAITGYNGTPQIDNTQIIGSPVAGAIGGTFTAAPVATGVATGNAFSYSEAGNFGLNANAVFDSGFTSVDQPNDCAAGFSNTLSAGKYGCGIGSTAVPLTIGASGFGRFIPDHFETVVSQVAGVPMNCPSGLSCPALFNGMVYSGQAYTANVNAKNAAGTVTQNYDSTAGYSRQVTLSAASSVGGGISAAGTISSGATVAAGAFRNGTTTLGTPASPAFTLSAAPASPANIYLRATDTDGVTSLLPAPNSANSVEGGVTVASGRLNVSNAYGSELLALPVYVTAQYWNGTAWVTSSTDSATALNASLVSASNWTNFTPGNWQKLFPASTWEQAPQA